VTFRPTASDVSVLSDFVANGRHALHPVSSSPSKIPYGGFSPVRLQTESRPQPSHATLSRPGLYAASSPSGVAWLIAALCRRPVDPRPNTPVQRPLARHRVVLSRRVIAYYGLIRGSDALPTPYVLRRRVFASTAEHQRFPNLSCVSFDPCRLPYPGGPGGLGLL
jgi:hypothetical protein